MSDLWKFPCEDPKCEPAKPRPYARDKQYPSATTLINLLSKGDGMTWAAAGVTADYCLDHYSELVSLERGAAWDKARKVHRAQWDNTAKLGKMLHSAAEAFALGESWDMPDDAGLNETDEEKVTAFITGLSDWWVTRNPHVLATELIVSRDNPNYCGTIDFLCEVDGEPVLIDWKSKDKVRDDESIYFESWVLQLQMYGLCARDGFVRHYHAGKLAGQLSWADTGLPVPTRGLIVSLTPDGSWREYETEISDDNLNVIDALVTAKQWKPSMRKVATGNQPEVIVSEARESVAASPGMLS